MQRVESLVDHRQNGPRVVSAHRSPDLLLRHRHSALLLRVGGIPDFRKLDRGIVRRELRGSDEDVLAGTLLEVKADGLTAAPLSAEVDETAAVRPCHLAEYFILS